MNTTKSRPARHWYLVYSELPGGVCIVASRHQSRATATKAKEKREADPGYARYFWKVVSKMPPPVRF